MSQRARASARQPLTGIRVVDLTSMVSGPLATCILADQGAEVIKIEPPGGGDLLRHMGYSRGGMSAIFASVNRGKRSLALDLQGPRGRGLARQLVRGADVFVQNLRPGAVEELGLGEPALRAAHPDLVYASISGFGRSGPYAQHPAYDVVIQALSGMAALQAEVEGGTPVLVQTVVCDKVAALHAAQAICAALLARERGAGGQHLELSLLGTSLAFLWPDGMQAWTLLGDGVAAPASGMRDIAQIHPTRDGFATVLAVSDEQFRGLCRALGAAGLAADPRFQSLRGRLDHARPLADAVRAALARLATSEACERLRQEGVPAAPALQPEAVLTDPHVLETRLFHEIDHPQAGALRSPRPAVDFAGVAPPTPRPAPALGQHSAEILAGIGVSGAELQQLLEDGLVQTG
jgi:crotonobetainyl-CoA:carnitine CoA-transferase CaiB-like acyl-CoA transferase